MSGSRLTALAVLAALGLGACVTPDRRRERSLAAAEVALAAGDVERAVGLLTAALRFDPRDRRITLRLARIFEESGDYRRALRLLKSFPENVDEPEWTNLRARLLLRCGRRAEGARLAVALAGRGAAEAATVQTLSDLIVASRLRAGPVDGLPDPWALGLVERLLEEGDPDAALSWLERTGEAADPEERRRLIEELAEAVLDSSNRSLVRRAAKLLGAPESPLGMLLDRRRLMLAGKGARVARLDERFLASFPDHPRRGEPLVAEARRRLALGDLERALELADEALTLDGGNVRALVVRGLSLEWSGRSDEGRAALGAALALDPGNQVAREALRSSGGLRGAIVMRVDSIEP